MSDSNPPPAPLGLPPNYPEEYIQEVTLRDGSMVTIRPIRPDDASRLQAGFARLSPQSIYLRFLESFKELPDKQAQNFATVDYQTRMALVAEIQENGRPHLIGVARYGLVEDRGPGIAESAVVVVDEYQGRGLGTILLQHLVNYAQAHDVRAFLATVHMTNAKIMRFVQKSGFPSEKKMTEPGVWEVQIFLEGGYDQPA